MFFFQKWNTMKYYFYSSRLSSLMFELPGCIVIYLLCLLYTIFQSALVHKCELYHLLLLYKMTPHKTNVEIFIWIFNMLFGNTYIKLNFFTLLWLETNSCERGLNPKAPVSPPKRFYLLNQLAPTTSTCWSVLIPIY